jgi:hypothetical protein
MKNSWAEPDRPETMPLHRQVDYVRRALDQNPIAQSVLSVASEVALPNWYFGAGGVAQTVWNLRHQFQPEEGIKDYDVVYFDPEDTSREAEERIRADFAGRVGDLGIAVDVKNQARVHLWYEARFGRRLDPYTSTEEAIATWPTTASSIGVRQEGSGFIVCAPFGLSDLVGMLVRPNKTIVTREVYEEKAGRWAKRWPKLRVIPW